MVSARHPHGASELPCSDSHLCVCCNQLLAMIQHFKARSCLRQGDHGLSFSQLRTDLECLLHLDKGALPAGTVELPALSFVSDEPLVTHCFPLWIPHQPAHMCTASVIQILSRFLTPTVFVAQLSAYATAIATTV